MSPPPAPKPAADAAVDVDAGLRAAMRVHQAGDAAAALPMYQALLAAAPEHPSLRNFLGMAQIQLHQFASGEDNVRRALRADPGYAEAWNSLGNLYRLTGRPEEALEAYLAMTRLAPGAVTGWINLADLYRQIGSRERGLQALARAVAIAEAHTGAGPAYQGRLLQGLAALARVWGQADEAARLFTLALQLDPADSHCRQELIQCLVQAGRRDEALREAEAWLVREPGHAWARRAQASLGGAGAPTRAADDEVAALFDSHAGTFDHQLAGLGYRAPALLEAAVRGRLGQGRGERVVCDAGCGTGLCAPWLRAHARRLEGVDLSQGMLDLAAERGLFDRLERAELGSFLQAAAQAGRYGLVVGADVLCYFGALEALLPAARAAMSAGGLLAFTVEHAAEPGPQGYQLQINGRYSHGEAYVRRCLAEAGFGQVEIARAELRLEGGLPVPGLVVTALRD